MANILNKDPVTYERERDSFLRELHHFHETRGTSFKKSPKISGKDIDLYLLYVLVTAHGGWMKVNTRNEWSALCEQFHLPGGCVNSGVGLKQIYLRYLDRYEKVHFLGEDGQQADDEDEDSRHRKWSARALHSVPLTYNYHQHNVAESLRDYNGLSANLYKPSNYDKLALSLLSPLPNEQDFAINVCTLLSNEGKHTLRLDKYPRLVNILLAHAGVFDSPGTRQLFIEVYSRVRNYSINSFWSDVLDSQDVIDLTDERIFMKKPTSNLNTFSRRKILEKEKPNKTTSNVSQDVEPVLMEVDVPPMDCLRLEPTLSLEDDNPTDQNQNSIKFEEDDKDLFCVGRTLGTQDPYGQRVLQIASILRNLSFTPENAAVLGRNRCFLRFVLLCTRARWSNLHQLGFDILGNIANEIILKEAGERITDAVLSCVAKGVSSQDRFIVISCLEILNKVSQQDSNEEIITFGLEDEVYELICRFLALSDIALLVYTLECLYALTSLGERPCTSVARVRGAIDTLVALVTVEAQSYGPKACILMRVVETVSTLTPAPPSTTGLPTPAAAAPAPVPVTPTRTPTPTPVPTPAQPISVPSPPIPIPPTPTAVSPVPSRPSTPATPATKVTAHKTTEVTTPVHHPIHAHQQVIQENEQFALGWLRATFEPSANIRIEQEELYKKYLGCCTKIGRRGVIAPLHFPKVVRSVFGNSIGPNPLKGETTGVQYYEGIRVRVSPPSTTHPSQNAVGTNTVTIPSINTTPVKVAQRQQQQRLLQQQLTGVVQPAAPGATPAPILIKAPVNSKSQKPAIATIPARKIQRLNGAKVIVTNNCDKTEVSDTENNSQTITSTMVVSTMTDNHISTSPKVCRPPQAILASNKNNQRVISTPLAEDSDSTNNSLASSSGIGGSRDCSGVGAEEENSLTSFEGILLNGAPNSLDMDAQDDGSSKDSSSIGSKDKPLQSMMLADLLERKVDKEPIMNGVLGKSSIHEEGMDLVENHIKKVLKESPTDAKIKNDVDGINVIQPEVSEDALIEAPRGMKRRTSEASDEVDAKKPKYSNGTTSPDPAADSTTIESTVSSIKSEDPDDDKATVSSTAANLYAALAADCIEDETDLEDPPPPLAPPPAPIKEEPVVVKEEPRTFINQMIQHQQHQQQPQQQLIVTGSRQIVVQQAIQSNNQIIIPATQLKGRTHGSQPQVLLQQSPSGQIQYVVSGGVPGQNYVLAQSQTALVQGQAQTVLVAQTTQQQGTGAKTIIILQPQSAPTQNTQKMVAMTPQGQQVVVTQVPRPLLQSSALANIPPPLVATSATIPQASIIVNSSVAQSTPNAMTVTIPAIAQQCPVTTSLPSRVVTPTPASTPPPTRPTTPHQAASTHGLPVKQAVKIVKTVSSSTSTEPESKPSTSQQTSENKTITIKIDPNAFLCEWRGCLRQFKTAHEVYLHVCEAHCPTNGEEILCLWASCDGLKRRKFSLMTHLYDRHCNSESMTLRRKQLTASGKTEISTSTPPTPHHPGYAPNAAFHAIKRHALEFVNPKELMQQRPTKPAAAISSSSSPRPGQNPPPEQDDNEGPVTKSIRLTAALILRNLVIYSAHGRRHLRAYEPHLAGVALSNVESSRTIAQVLYDMNDQSNSTHR
ncbi:AT-rich interactive domain-containing protein 2 isoform X7 [Venturia canescens]|uniref:AT-rich interactive domain-containing protein 2 isoform X7 n=1 Tax=Venturia canescens TaxID=32260 RepID=UPI001C9C4363|nr:AT-rich interactive domain-containing protein 2 isoform X7 [Venturia canescens]